MANKRKILKSAILMLLLANLFFAFDAQVVYAQQKEYKDSGVQKEIEAFLCTPTDSKTNPDAAKGDLYNCINKIYRFALIIVSVLGVFMIAIGGWVYMAAAGNEESVTKAKDILLTTIISLIVIFSGYVLLKFLNPDLIRFQRIQPASVVGRERAYSFDKVTTQQLEAFFRLDKLNPASQTFPTSEVQACKSITGNVNGFFQFSQCSGSWATKAYGSCSGGSTIGSSACGPTSLAAVLNHYKNKGQTKPNDKVKNLTINPETMANLSVELKMRVCGSGTSSAFFAEVAAMYGLKAQQVSGWNNIASEINAGHPVVASMGPGKFTTGGHFIVLHKIQGDKILIADSGPRGITESDIATVQREMKYAIVIKP